jgi:hypothetical protein
MADISCYDERREIANRSNLPVLVQLSDSSADTIAQALLERFRLTLPPTGAFKDAV